ncbi:MAG: chromosome segregation protein SMC [Fretibacterium sp.]|nr:chromosome segregation protein SMC [Fretibacterium sp.]
MSIESLRLKGFKSFGTPCELLFSRGFTAIVGPNGSGKSNILDALRWILGEGGNSALRVPRQTELLFKGSASVREAKEAEVSLTLSVPGDGAVLKRLYSAEEGGSLQIDGKRITVQELDSVKSRFSMDGQGCAFIGQGEVAAAIKQSPRERRRQLDLLFGIDRYRNRRDDTLKRLEDALAEAERIKTLIQELETRRAEIAGEVAVAVKAQGILDSLESLRRDFYFSRRYRLEAEARELGSKQQQIRARLERAVMWRGFWGFAVQAGEAHLRSQGFDEAAFTARAHELSSRRDVLQRQGFQAATRIRSLLDDRVALEAERKELAEQEAGLREEQERIQAEEAEQRARLEECRAALDARLREFEEGRAHLERERTRRQSLRDELAERQLFCSRTEAELRALSVSGESGASELERLQEEARQRTSAGRALAIRLEELEMKYTRLMDEHTGIYSFCQKQTASLQQMQRECGRLEAELDSLRDSAESSYPEPVRILLSASRLKRMKSRPEVAAEAFSCPVNIAFALDAYLGGRRFWLLVHTLEEAQEGIALLKQRRSNRGVTYLPLERCRPRDRDCRFSLPAKGIVGWAMDLIDVHSPWGPALSHMMGDLLIVGDYGLGSALVRKGARFPIVTLEGEVFSPTGTVSGGQVRQQGGVIANNQQAAETQSGIDALRGRIAELDGELKAAREKEAKLAGELDSLAGERERIRADAAAEQRALTAASASIERLTSEGAEARGRISALSGELDRAQARVKELEAALAELGDLPEGEPDSALAPLRSELSLAEERLRGTLAIAERIRHEQETLTARRTTLEEELRTGQTTEAENRKLLGEIGQERLTIFHQEKELHRRFEEEQTRVRRAHLRLERLRARSEKADSTAAQREGEISAAAGRQKALEEECHQLIELWDEKYPYNVLRGREVANGDTSGDGPQAASGPAGLTASLKRLERELKALGPYNLGALSEDASLTERTEFLTEQLEDVRSGVEELRMLIRETDEQVENAFTGAMTEIDTRFNALFQRLFGGGEARLTLQDGESIWDRGVEIYARPPGKNLQNITQLSGGEQALTAIAQLFAAMEVAKVPLAVLDEADAALDEYNLIRFADLSKEYSRTIQLIVVTHRRTTMERADLIYGVTMVEPGLSKIVGIDVENYR